MTINIVKYMNSILKEVSSIIYYCLKKNKNHNIIYDFQLISYFMTYFFVNINLNFISFDNFFKKYRLILVLPSAFALLFCTFAGELWDSSIHPLPFLWA